MAAAGTDTAADVPAFGGTRDGAVLGGVGRVAPDPGEVTVGADGPAGETISGVFLGAKFVGAWGALAVTGVASFGLASPGIRWVDPSRI